MGRPTEGASSPHDPKGIDWDFVLGQEGGNWLVGYVPNLANKEGVITSGVTILFGFDLGQQKMEDIKRFKIKDEIKEKLYPFLGLQGRDAVLALQRPAAESTGWPMGSIPEAQGIVNKKGHVLQWVALSPADVVHHGKTVTVQSHRPELEKTGLVLKEEEATALAPCVKQLYLERLAAAFNYAGKHKRRPHFGVLRHGVQTALMSLSWHRGNIWKRKHSSPERKIFEAAVEGRWEHVVGIFREGFVHTQFAKRRRDEGNLVAKAMGIDQMRPRDVSNLTTAMNQVFAPAQRTGENSGAR